MHKYSLVPPLPRLPQEGPWFSKVSPPRLTEASLARFRAHSKGEKHLTLVKETPGD